MIYYDNTRVSSFKNCPRHFYLRHIKNLRGEGTAPALIFGLCWHEAMDVVWDLMCHPDPSRTDVFIVDQAMKAFQAKWEEEGATPFIEMDLDDQVYWEPRTPGTAAEMLHQYINLRREFFQDVELIAIEQPFMVDIGMEGIRYVGRFDKVIRKKSDGRIYCIEHKTTTAYKKDGGFRTDYLESWSPNSQIDGYNHAGHMIYGKDFKEVHVDAALVHKQVHDKFKFIPVSKSMGLIEGWLAHTQDWIRNIQAERARHALYLDHERINQQLQAAPMSYMPTFPMNTESCHTYNGCGFRDICRFKANPAIMETTPLGYVVDEWKPFDVLELSKINAIPEQE